MEESPSIGAWFEYYFEKIKILNEENPNPMVIKDLKFFFADEWQPTAIGKFRRVWLTTPVCESTLPDIVVNNKFNKKVIEAQNTIIYWASQGGQSIETAGQTCKSKGLVIMRRSFAFDLKLKQFQVEIFNLIGIHPNHKLWPNKGLTLPIIKSDEENDFYKTFGNNPWLGIKRQNDPDAWIADDGQIQNFFNWKNSFPKNPDKEIYAQSLLDLSGNYDHLL